MEIIRVMIVEDDIMVVKVNAKMTEAMEGFKVMKIANSEDDPLMECVDHILKNRVRRMPVLNKTGKVVGMVYMRDIFYAITKVMLEESNGGEK
jgi:CBS domain-containing protein